MISRFAVTQLLSLAAAVLLAAPVVAPAADNPALWKHRTKGDFQEVTAQLKQSLMAAQFQITAEENLSRGLENNRHLFPEGRWNTIGFDHVTAIHFCSLVFNQEVFNIDLDWSILCPFKLVAYTTKKAPQDITIVLVRPTYLLERDKNARAREIGGKIEERILTAIREGL